MARSSRCEDGVRGMNPSVAGGKGACSVDAPLLAPAAPISSARGCMFSDGVPLALPLLLSGSYTHPYPPRTARRVCLLPGCQAKPKRGANVRHGRALLYQPLFGRTTTPGGGGPKGWPVQGLIRFGS